MSDLPPFDFEELAGHVHRVIESMTARHEDRDAVAAKTAEEGLTHQQAVASYVAAAMQTYAEASAPALADGTPLNSRPDWRYVNKRCADLLTQIYVDRRQAALQRAAQHAMHVDAFAASCVTTDLRDYLKDGKVCEIETGIPDEFLDKWLE